MRKRRVFGREIIMRLFRYAVMVVAALFLSSAPARAGQAQYAEGEVVYHQDFSEISDIAFSGIRNGTSSTPQSSLVCDNETFSINVFDDGRAYALLPPSDWTESFTVEFDFSFTDIASSNGYIALMLTSTGEEPGNISSVVFRARGSVDSFEEVSEEIAESMKNGEKITVKVPVEKGALHEIVLSANGVTQTLTRSSLLLVGSGNRGFTVRNASVKISEAYIVNGVDYTEKTGYWAENSYIEDDVPIFCEEASSETGKAPATGDALVPAVVVAASAVVVKKIKSNVLK